MSKNPTRISKSVEWYTPDWIYDLLDSEYYFTLDPCCVSPEVAKCERFYAIDQDGLSQNWTDERLFINPPYGKDMPKWIEKAFTSNVGLCCLLLPSYTGSKWYHRCLREKCMLRFVEGRVRFGGDNVPMFDSLVVVIDRNLSLDRCVIGESIVVPSRRGIVDVDDL